MPGREAEATIPGERIPRDLDPPGGQDDRTARLQAAKLRALVAEGWGRREAEHARPGRFPLGAALVGEQRVWVIAAGETSRSLGPAMAWCSRNAANRSVQLLVERDAGLLARRAAQFRGDLSVWQVDGREVRVADPAPFPVAVLGAAAGGQLPSALEPFAALMRGAGAEPVVDGGVLVAEVLGLEVGRVVRAAARPGDTAEPGDEWVLEVGVGRHDRDAHSMLHGGSPSAEALAGVVVKVRQHRRGGVPAHPANQLAQARWLRAVLLRHPEIVDAADLTPLPEPSVASARWEAFPCACLGRGPGGQALVAVCSVGVDMDLVPAAADIKLWVAASGALSSGASPLLVLAVPEGHDLPITRELASRLVEPAHVRTVPNTWKQL